MTGDDAGRITRRPPGKGHRLRALVAGGLVGLVLSLLAGRLWIVQVHAAEERRRQAWRQDAGVIEEPGRRGDVRFRGGEVLARSVRVRSIFADIPNIDDPVGFCVEVGQALGLDPAERTELLRRIREPGSAFAWVHRGTSPEEARRVEGRGIPGARFREEARRVHPAARLAPHVVGLTDPDGRPLSGVELTWDRVLDGVDGFREVARDGAGQPIAPAGAVDVPPLDGRHVRLTLDRTVQAACEDALDRVVREFEPSGAVACAIDPRTGAVLAMANRPTYDPRQPGEAPPDAWRNRVVTDFFPPGSTFKPLVAARALDLDLARLDETIDCHRGVWRHRARTIHDAHAMGRIPLAEVIVHSSNIGMAQIGLRLGAERLQELLRRLGLGRPTGISLPGEAAGLVTPASDWNYFSTTSVPMGQELGTTPLQLCQAFAALANDGVRMEPHLVDAILDPEGRVVGRHRPRAAARICSPETARAMTDVLCRVVSDPEGTGRRASIEGLRVAGKTGTAQHEVDGPGEDYVSSFIAFAPADDPALCVLVMVDRPHGSHYGGVVAAPAVRHVIRASLPALREGDGGEPGPYSGARPTSSSHRGRGRVQENGLPVRPDGNRVRAGFTPAPGGDRHDDRP